MWRTTPAYNSSLRQLLHVGFKIAAKMGPRYLDLLEANEAVIAKNVTENLYRPAHRSCVSGAQPMDARARPASRILYIPTEKLDERPNF